MVNIGELVDNKLISLALQGYNPFQPDVGIFCGGYQGVMYPNPTTLIAPNFDPYNFLEPMPSPYTPGDNYNGLGQGNPGIDYKNPGHILGILDTFGRMSYGISTLLRLHSAGNEVGIEPLIDINMPFFLADGTESPVGISDIYPNYTEVPIDWLNGFAVNSSGEVTPDPRPLVSLPVLPGYILSSNEIDQQAFRALFSNKTLGSYVDLPQYLRDIIQQFVDASSSLYIQSSADFTLDGNKSTWTSKDHLIFEKFLNREFLDASSIFIPSILTSLFSFENKGTAYFNYQNTTASGALKTFNGSTGYHLGVSGIHDYRSMTELNCVVNVIPLQMVGATYWKEGITKPSLALPLSEDGRNFTIASYMLADFVINISNTSSEPKTITIDGNAIARNLVTDPTQYWYIQHRFDLQGTPPVFVPLPLNTISAQEWIEKGINILVSLTNDFSWDKQWLGIQNINKEQTFEDRLAIDNLALVDEVADQTPMTLSFNKTFTLGIGCNSLRLRAFIDSSHFLWIKSRLQDGALPPNFDVPVGDLDNVKRDIASPGLELSFTVSGPNIDTETYSVEV